MVLICIMHPYTGTTRHMYNVHVDRQTYKEILLSFYTHAHVRTNTHTSEGLFEVIRGY